ncbi:MAG TPA: radical SAM protein [Polyangiaceae bacterium]|nr:radical SAM protein [Polyangiaceae bacterium]
MQETIAHKQFELTAVGRLRQALLDELATAHGGRAFGQGWHLAGGLPGRPGFLFQHSEGRQLTLRLLPKKTLLCFAKTRFFALVHEGCAIDRDADGPFLREIVASISTWEASLASSDGFPGLLLEQRSDAVVFYPDARTIEVRPSLACDHQCGFCNSVDRRIENVFRGIEDVLQSIPAWASLPIDRVVISGGEPTLIKRLPELIAAVAAAGYTVELQTHGMALAEREYAEILQRSGLRNVLISLHSPDPAVSDRFITRVPGAWARTVAGIDNAVALGLRVEVSHVVHADNAGAVRAFLEFIAARWGRNLAVRMAFVAPTKMSSAEVERYVPRLPEILPELRRALAYAEQQELRVLVVAYCGVPPCLLAPHHRLSEVVLRPQTRYSDENHVKLTACNGCQYAAGCPGLWRSYHEVHGDPGLAAVHR